METKPSTSALKVKKSDIKQSAKTLHEAFRNDASIQWIFGDSDLYDKVGLQTLETWIKYCVLYGLAIRTEHFEAVALRQIPGDDSFSAWRLFRSGMYRLPKILGKEAFGRLMVFEKLSETQKAKLLDGKPCMYCWMLGTLPDQQRKGYGKQLMQYTFDLAKQHHAPCYLECVDPHASKVHQHYGYKVLATETVPDSSLSVEFMLREND